jgi:hypothetical protein
MSTSTAAPEESNGIIDALKAIRDKLAKQNTRGEPLKIKEAVLGDIDNLIADVANKDSTFPAPDTCSTNIPQDQALHFSKLENDITEIKQALRESLQVSKTWAQVARNSSATPGPQNAPTLPPILQRNCKFKQKCDENGHSTKSH